MNSINADLHPTKLIIDKSAIAHNISNYRQVLDKDTRIMLMIKALGYGIGDVKLAQYLEEEALVDYLGVAYINEGIALREEGITLPIMIMNTGVIDLEKVLAFDLEPTIYNPEQLGALLTMNPNDIKRIKVHFKIDSGMHRLGFRHEEIGPAAFILLEQGITVVGAYTHLASSPEPVNDDFTLEQLDYFDRASEELADKLGYQPARHVLNSAGILRFTDRQYEMVRGGMGIYGLDPSHTQQENFIPVGRLVTEISQINVLDKGETVGYVRRGKIERDNSRIAVLPVGYADGYNRLWSNGNARVFINGQYAPTIGNVCMDMTFVDVTDIDCSIGDEVELYGPNVDIRELAAAANSIDYEVMTRIGQRVARVYE